MHFFEALSNIEVFSQGGGFPIENDDKHLLSSVK